MNPSTVSIVLPTYNEAENMADLIKLILHHVPSIKEIIVVDDNSPDGTADIVRRLAKRTSHIRLICRVHERGLASALARGISEARGDIIGWMDADLSMPPSTLPKLLRWIPEYDIVIGSRYVAGGSDTRGVLRWITSRMINLFTNIVLGSDIKDYNSGFVMARRKVFRDMHFSSEGYGQYCIRFLYDCLRHGYRVKELGYIFTNRSRGVSKTGESLWPLLRHGWNYGLEVIKIRFGK